MMELMKVFVVGVTGLLGYEGAVTLAKRGHRVTGMALNIPEGLEMPKGVEVILGNFMEMPDAKLLQHLEGQDAVVFAAGIDERVEGKPPIYDLFKKYNIDALKRLADLAVQAGVKNLCVLGSYFSYFDKKWSKLKLAQNHPYIRSRADQEKLAFWYHEQHGMNVSVLELPYIFGAQKGRKPVWLFLAEMVKNTKGNKMYYPKGGTTMVTSRQVGEAIAGAVVGTKGAVAYPVGWFNMSWVRFLEKFSKDLGDPKKVVSIPTFLYKIFAWKMSREAKARGVEPGLDMVKFSKVMTAKTYIDKKYVQAIGVKEDGINRAVRESAEVCLDVMNSPEKDFKSMEAK